MSFLFLAWDTSEVVHRTPLRVQSDATRDGTLAWAVDSKERGHDHGESAPG
jgi:hypothetical protein